MVLLQKYKHKEMPEEKCGQAYGLLAKCGQAYGQQAVYPAVGKIQKRKCGQAYGQKAVYLAVINFPEPKSP